MTSTKPRPNFNIVERKPTPVDYEQFKKDFLNPSIEAKQVRIKHNITHSEYREYRDRVLDETGLTRKPTYCGKNTRTDSEFIRKQYDGFAIYKTVDGLPRYFGKYKNIDTAKTVRDRLVECDWDEDEADRLREEYSIRRRRPAYDKAVEMFPEFEKHYFEKKHSIKEITEMMGLSDRQYLYLVQMIKEKYGKLYRRR